MGCGSYCWMINTRITDNCESLGGMFNFEDLSGWDVSQVENMVDMFIRARSLTELDVSDCDDFNDNDGDWRDENNRTDEDNDLYCELEDADGQPNPCKI